MAKAKMYLSQLEVKKSLMLDDIKEILTEIGNVSILDKNVKCDVNVSIHVWDDVEDNEVLADVVELQLLTDGRIWFIDEHGNNGELSDKSVTDVYNVLEWLEVEVVDKKSVKCSLSVLDNIWLDEDTFVVNFEGVEEEEDYGEVLTKVVVGEYHHDEGRITISVVYYDEVGDCIGCADDIEKELSAEEIKKVREIVIKEAAKSLGD